MVGDSGPGAAKKVHKSKPFGGGSRSAAARKERKVWGKKRERKMKEKSLIETAKMQGNVLVRWIIFVHAC